MQLTQEHLLTLDYDKSYRKQQRTHSITMRQGENKSIELVMIVNCSDNAVDLSVCESVLKMTLPDGSYHEQKTYAGHSQSEIRADIPSAIASVEGVVTAYLESSYQGDVVNTTETFEIEVLPGADITAAQAETYTTRLDSLVNKADKTNKHIDDIADRLLDQQVKADRAQSIIDKLNDRQLEYEDMSESAQSTIAQVAAAGVKVASSESIKEMFDTSIAPLMTGSGSGLGDFSANDLTELREHIFS